MGSDLVGDLKMGGLSKQGGGEEEGLLEGLFEGVLPEFSPKLR